MKWNVDDDDVDDDMVVCGCLWEGGKIQFSIASATWLLFTMIFHYAPTVTYSRVIIKCFI